MAWTEMIEAREARLAGDTTGAEARFESAKELAAVRGFRYMPAARVAKLPRDELLQRIEAVQAPGGEPDKLEAAAILGAAPEPQINVSRALELYWTLARSKTLGKLAERRQVGDCALPRIPRCARQACVWQARETGPRDLCQL